MKIFVVLLPLTAVMGLAYTVMISKVVEKNQLKPEEESCVSQLRLNRDQIKTLNSQETTPEDNPDFNAFIACYWRKIGWQNNNGEINFESLKVSLQENVAGNVDAENTAATSLLKQMVVGAVEECQRIQPSSNFGQTAVKVQNCIVKMLHELMKEHVSLISQIL